MKQYPSELVNLCKNYSIKSLSHTKKYSEMIYRATYFLPVNIKCVERIYYILNNIHIREKCDICDNPTNIRHKSGIYKKALCSTKCLGISNSKIKKNDIKNVIDLYVNQYKSMKEIGILYKCSSSIICYILKNNNIKARVNGTPDYIPILSKELLYQLYFTDGLSMYKIYKIYHDKYRNHGHVSSDLYYHGFTPRTYKDASINMYNVDPMLRSKCTEHFFNGSFKYPCYNTTLELAFINWANAILLKFVQQFQFIDFYHRYDFLISGTNIIVEMDGVYWHTRDNNAEMDKLFDNEAFRRGYIVVRITDEEVKINKNIFNEKLGEFICQYDEE